MKSGILACIAAACLSAPLIAQTTPPPANDQKAYAALAVRYADAFKSYNATVVEEQAAVANEKAGHGDRAITCGKITLAIDELLLAQDILKQMIAMVDKAHQDDTSFWADVKEQDSVLQKWRANEARACAPAEPAATQTVSQKLDEIHSLTAGIRESLQSAVTYGNMGARAEACRASNRAGEQLDKLDEDIRYVSAAMQTGGYTDAERSQWAETADKAVYWSKSEREVAITDWRNTC